jgi:protein SCO1/2
MAGPATSRSGRPWHGLGGHRPRSRALALATSALFFLAGCQPPSAPFHGADLTGAEYGQHWQLIDDRGKPRTLTDYRGQVLLVYFGFTHCPDVCPATLAHLHSALDLLGADGGQVRALFVTVDADADTPAALHAYLAPFGTQFTGLTGSAEALAAAAKDFKVYAARKADGSTGGSFEHAGFVYALDGKGRPRVLYDPSSTPQDMADDVRRLLKERDLRQAATAP